MIAIADKKPRGTVQEFKDARGRKYYRARITYPDGERLWLKPRFDKRERAQEYADEHTRIAEKKNVNVAQEASPPSATSATDGAAFLPATTMRYSVEAENTGATFGVSFPPLPNCLLDASKLASKPIHPIKQSTRKDFSIWVRTEGLEPCLEATCNEARLLFFSSKFASGTSISQRSRPSKRTASISR